MIVQCGFCGGENRAEPGQRMLACAWCGASLALESPRGPEHLVLAHLRNDAAAEAALRSFLIEKGRRRPDKTAIEYSLVPFSLAEAQDGRPSIEAAAASWRMKEQIPYPPAGEYRFFDESHPPGESVVPADRIGENASQLLHLPVYSIRYEASCWRGRAVVVGESWQVLAEDLPPELPRRPGTGRVAAALGLFAGYYLIARLVPHVVARFALLAAVSCAAWGVFVIRERVKG